ncbi:AAA family ATPase [Bifidobacterium sp. ESL0732]|uniref:McrB family protein n=1 Tax=Bifidobacterium sp. ESL0732 TaxID=2983222 RepID=UPI0023F94953|nr:AAA family ATPase [Bifidobacterium sp. ESL0732]WEV64113.1 AAA family ATPase [Bifidobacterium sp. ESL0732]
MVQSGCIKEQVSFYEEVADKLSAFRQDSRPLLAKIKNVDRRMGISPRKYLINVIDPFTVYNLFNAYARTSNFQNRQHYMSELKSELAIKAPVPTDLKGISIRSAGPPTFYRTSVKNRRVSAAQQKEDIENLWLLFEAARVLESDDTNKARQTFMNAYDVVLKIPGLKWSLTNGLSWLNLQRYVSLSEYNRRFIQGQRQPVFEKVAALLDNNPPNGGDYLELCDDCLNAVQSEKVPYSSLQDMSYHAWESHGGSVPDASMSDTEPSSNRDSLADDAGVGSNTSVPSDDGTGEKRDGAAPTEATNPRVQEIFEMMTRRHGSPNVILHGAPGTGKTTMAKQIAAKIIRVPDVAALAEDDFRFDFVQFHPSYDYTDFVEGIRPVKAVDSRSGFELRPGVFMRFINKARKDPERKYVFVIDEINRGNISEIFGELFFSIDPGYRGLKGKVKTQYANLHDDNDKKSSSNADKDDSNDWFYIPENVYIIATMNDIDRSVDTFDFAMRRRFRFVPISVEDSKVMLSGAQIGQAEAFMDKVNDEIKVSGLGSGYCIGASYFVNMAQGEETARELWKNELKPLLIEYQRIMPESDGARTLQDFEEKEDQEVDSVEPLPE